MPSFLITPRMDPALAARVRQSLSGDATSRMLSPKGRLRHKGLLRVGLALGVLTLVLVLGTTYRKSRREVEELRQNLAADFAAVSSHYERELKSQQEVAVHQIILAAKKQLPEERATSLESPKELSRELERPLLYVRGSLPDLQSEPSLREVADGEIDALYSCLSAPPDSTKETSLLRHLGKARIGADVHALGDVFALRDFIDSSFSEELARAEHMSQLQRLEKRLKQRTKGFADLRADRLLYVIDEPLASGVRSDFDGEGKHHLRIGLIALPSGKVLLRRRREVSPEWISDRSRLAFSRPLDSCKLAYQLNWELTPRRLEKRDR